MKNLEKARRQGREAESRRRERRLGFSYAELLQQQDGKCAICGSSESGRTRNGRTVSFHSDHDHATGRVRALLCHPCNAGLGFFKDDSARLRWAAEYIEKFRGPAA